MILLPLPNRAVSQVLFRSPCASSILKQSPNEHPPFYKHRLQPTILPPDLCRVNAEVGDTFNVFTTSEHKLEKHTRDHEGGGQGKGFHDLVCQPLWEEGSHRHPRRWRLDRHAWALLLSPQPEPSAHPYKCPSRGRKSCTLPSSCSPYHLRPGITSMDKRMTSAGHGYPPCLPVPWLPAKGSALSHQLAGTTDSQT